MTRKKFNQNLIPPSPELRFEKDLWKQGLRYVAGIDEAGRGALAGPVIAAAVILPPSDQNLKTKLDGVRDSKQMTPKQREKWSVQIRKHTLSYAIGKATPVEIDTYGILPATKLAIRRALLNLRQFPDHLLIDALHLPQIPVPQTILIKGDARSLSIAAASVLAKTARDKLMIALDAQYPDYGFASHKGYGTNGHLSSLRERGATPIHRKSFKPLKLRLIKV